jgi:hypothetical protein
MHTIHVICSGKYMKLDLAFDLAVSLQMRTILTGSRAQWQVVSEARLVWASQAGCLPVLQL